ncbi:COP9 signalosome complex subunit 7 isoform X2 [Prunus yedoensis var. nudiflora]|uniref:COP9 signalosome complex subunit 7 isoform X2 n=1 Tax=Prunus yedoensis var. nudiflora TaxID=2094558 RepID=A0A314XP26_PRUYE|nr:COP9 signalosome complex subunit 7 isoform X2 [Prunus yedoensis var. nudiflora]
MTRAPIVRFGFAVRAAQLMLFVEDPLNFNTLAAIFNRHESIHQLEGTETSMNLDVLCLFSQGTWSDYKSDASRLPQLVPDQVLKLKQLTVLTLAETNKA